MACKLLIRSNTSYNDTPKNVPKNPTKTREWLTTIVNHNIPIYLTNHVPLSIRFDVNLMSNASTKTLYLCVHVVCAAIYLSPYHH